MRKKLKRELLLLQTGYETNPKVEILFILNLIFCGWCFQFFFCIWQLDLYSILYSPLVNST